MGLFKGMKDLKDINDMSKQYKRPSMLEGLAQAKEAMAGIQETQRVTANGVAGTARVLGVTDTGATLNEHPVCEIQLEVTVPGEGPYTTTIRQAIPRMQAPMLQPGTPLPVKVDPADRDSVVLDWQSQGEQAMTLAGQAMQSGGATAAQDPVARLERLQALKDKGLLSEAEFEAQKQRILGDI
ncbi:MAG TPA: SHOCT domain-containing protein [Solirubrobacteraceae bacterium]|nr:SHOCT domain-containing protein [Solirubrobacteraceae bacterium]